MMKAGWIGFPKDDGDFWESAEMYAKIGYRGMEGGEALLGKGNDTENIQRFHDLGLEVLTVSTSVEEVKESIEPVIERARLLHTNRATIWAGSVMYYVKPPVKKDFFKEIEVMETAAATLAKENIKLCYHNHDREFNVYYDNVTAIDHMMENSKNIWLELDIGWVNYAHLCPSTVLKKYADRIGAVHLKDYIQENTVYYSGEDSVKIPVFTSLGTGIVDIINVLKCMNEINMDWAIYEQDTLRNLNSMESMTISYLHMKETGLIV